MIFFNELLIILGGRGHHSNNAILPTEVYNTETCELYKFVGIPMNRQSNFVYQTNIFLYGISLLKNKADVRKAFSLMNETFEMN